MRGQQIHYYNICNTHAPFQMHTEAKILKVHTYKFTEHCKLINLSETSAKFPQIIE